MEMKQLLIQAYDCTGSLYKNWDYFLGEMNSNRKYILKASNDYEKVAYDYEFELFIILASCQEGE